LRSYRTSFQSYKLKHPMDQRVFRWTRVRGFGEPAPVYSPFIFI
jgi:hypothetical protein